MEKQFIERSDKKNSPETAFNYIESRMRVLKESFQQANEKLKRKTGSPFASELDFNNYRNQRNAIRQMEKANNPQTPRHRHG